MFLSLPHSQCRVRRRSGFRPSSVRSLKWLVRFSRKPLSCVVVAVDGGNYPPASPGALRVSCCRRRVFRIANLSALPPCTPPRVARRRCHTARGLPPPVGRLDPTGVAARPAAIRAFSLTLFLSTSPRSDSWHRFGRNFACAYIRPYHRGLQAGLCVACFSPFRLRVSHYSSHTFPMDDTRPPWVTELFPTVSSAHTLVRRGGAHALRPQSAGLTIPRLRPTGSSLGIAPVVYDPVVLLKPFGPRLAAGALPSRASSMVAPGRPIRVPAFAVVPHEPLHTLHRLWPVRRYPHLRIWVRGPGPSGTSTHLTRQLPGTHSESVREVILSVRCGA